MSRENEKGITRQDGEKQKRMWPKLISIGFYFVQQGKNSIFPLMAIKKYTGRVTKIYVTVQMKTFWQQLYIFEGLLIVGSDAYSLAVPF